jgi:integrase
VREVRNGRWVAIALTQDTLRVNHSEGQVDRMVYLSPDGVTALPQWHGHTAAARPTPFCLPEHPA